MSLSSRVLITSLRSTHGSCLWNGGRSTTTTSTCKSWIQSNLTRRTVSSSLTMTVRDDEGITVSSYQATTSLMNTFIFMCVLILLSLCHD